MECGDFEELIMDVYRQAQTNPDTTLGGSIISYMRHQQGTLMSLAKRANQPLDYGDESTDSRKLWAIGSIYAAAQCVVRNDDYNQSVEIQRKITCGSPHIVSEVIRALMPFNVKLSTSKYGNFVVQAAINHATPSLYHGIYNSLVGSFALLSDDSVGCWVMFALLEKASHEQRQYIKAELQTVGLNANAHSFKVWQMFQKYESTTTSK